MLSQQQILRTMYHEQEQCSTITLQCKEYKKRVKQACIPSYYLQLAQTLGNQVQTSHYTHTGGKGGMGSLAL